MAARAEMFPGAVSLVRDITDLVDRMRSGAATVHPVDAAQFRDLLDRLHKLHEFASSLTTVTAVAFEPTNTRRKLEYRDAIKLDLDMMLKRLKTAVNVSSATHADGDFIRKTKLNLKNLCGASLSDWTYDMNVGGFRIDDHRVWFVYDSLAYHLVRIGSSGRQYEKCKDALIKQYVAHVKPQPAICKRKRDAWRKYQVGAASSLFEMSKLAATKSDAPAAQSTPCDEFHDFHNSHNAPHR